MGGSLSLFRRRKEQYISTDREPDSEEYEEIEYEPISVKEILIEMKDISELIVDLAYSAIVLDSKDISEEVHDMETRMATLQYHARLQAMMAARTADDAEQLAGILQVASAANRIASAAADIAALTGSTKDLKTTVPRLLRDADETLSRLRISEGSAANGATIGEANIETETGNRIIAVRRKSTWIYGPGRRFVLKTGDTLICRGREDGVEHLKSWLDGKEASL